MDRAVVEQKSELDPVTVHSHNMEVKHVQDKPQGVLAVTQIHVQQMEDGAPGVTGLSVPRPVVEEMR